MHNLHIDIDQIYDLLAVRIIVDTVKDCYTMLGEIHTMWKPMPGRFKDYIAMPKANNYQSLHTTVVTQYNETFEIQIRTYEMHKVAEYGVAAHWKYKEGTTGKDSELDSKVRWLREVMDAQKDIDGAKEFMDAVKINVFDDEVFVFTPKGDVFDLPVGSTPLDLAYKIHSAIGNKCIGAKVNKRMVPFSTKLQNGDIVEIITSNSSKGPSLDWLKFVHTASARSKIRAYFKKEKKDENIARGKEMLEKEAKRRGYALADIFTPDILSSILQRHAMSSEDDLYAAVGFGGLTTSQVLTKIIQDFKKRTTRSYRKTSQAFRSPSKNRENTQRAAFWSTATQTSPCVWRSAARPCRVTTSSDIFRAEEAFPFTEKIAPTSKAWKMKDLFKQVGTATAKRDSTQRLRLFAKIRAVCLRLSQRISQTQNSAFPRQTCALTKRPALRKLPLRCKSQREASLKNLSDNCA